MATTFSARTAQSTSSLDTYKAHVRARALRVKRDMNWPTDKMNETLVALGLDPITEFTVQLRWNAPVIYSLGTFQVDTPEEAIANAVAGAWGVTSDEEIRAYLERNAERNKRYASISERDKWELLTPMPEVVQVGLPTGSSDDDE